MVELSHHAFSNFEPDASTFGMQVLEEFKYDNFSWQVCM